jgi:hypothetical protein
MPTVTALIQGSRLTSHGMERTIADGVSIFWKSGDGRDLPFPVRQPRFRKTGECHLCPRGFLPN